jgi:hypothetical protein
MRRAFLTALWERIYGLVARDILGHFSTEEILSEAGQIARLEEERKKLLEQGNEEAAQFLDRELERARRTDSDRELSAFIKLLSRETPGSPLSLSEVPPAAEKPRRGRPKGTAEQAISSNDK